MTYNSEKDLEGFTKKQDANAGNDAIIINIRDSTELKFWSGKFGVSKDEIKNAVKEVGGTLSDVEQYVARLLAHENPLLLPDSSKHPHSPVPKVRTEQSHLESFGQELTVNRRT